MKRTATATLLFAILTLPSFSQRFNTDRLDRGLVAIKTQQGVYCSWRIQADEYYDVCYNIYRDGVKLNDVPLSVSNFTDAAGTASSHYVVRAVSDGKEAEACTEAGVWTSDYLEIVPHHDASLTSTYVPNDACCADIDGDGVVEILLKYDNSEEISSLFPKNGHNGEYSLFECLKLDGTVLWWVNCGPNMGDFQNNEQNIVGYDWDGDGKAEAVMRLAEGSCIHMADGTTYTIGANGQNGSTWTNYRTPKQEGGVEWFTHYGNEFLLYVEGATGKPYQCIDFPLRRYEPGETSLKAAWGDDYGHRSSKYFFGAPYLDGKKPSIFLGRGIYTRHKFVALDVNPETHELTERWRWTNNQPGSPWYGQGYHNYSIADVDWDGRDEIVWGSMVIDDNGKGLSTTGLGHGDAHHIGDFNPYVHGQEMFACNEDEPANNYRDATTSKIYYRMTDTNDDGRSMCGNFTDDFPGAMGVTSHDSGSPISCVTNGHLPDFTAAGVTQNFRIYWDGDLCDESFNGSATRNSTGSIFKYGRSSAIKTLSGSITNNDTKATPCYQGDILGDWREEVIMRTSANNIRIYSTTIPTEWRNYSLWYDHQYRNAMVWQMCGYNQPPHVSYFIGELEGITMAPPPLTTQGREIVSDGGTIGSGHDGKHVLVHENANATVNVAEGAKPSILTLNVPTWVQGTAASECTRKETDIKYETYTLSVTGAALTGDMRLVKQGDGILSLPSVTQTYSGSTDVWAGTIEFDGIMQNSHVWLNRFAELNSDGGNFQNGIDADYASVIRPGGKNRVGSVTVSDLSLGFGSRVVFDVSADACDKLNAHTVSIEKKDWQNGPEYSTPVFEFVCATGKLEAGGYLIAEIEEIQGSVDDILVEGLSGQKKNLSYVDGRLYLIVPESRDPQTVTWTGSNGSVWDMDNAENFSTGSESVTFVADDDVIFDDTADNTNVIISEDVYPSSVTFAGSNKTYTLSGDGAIAGAGSLSVVGGAKVNINNVNKYTGGTSVTDGTIVAASLANSEGAAYGSLGGVSNTIQLQNEAVLSVRNGMTASHPIRVGATGGTINVASGTLVLNGSIARIPSDSRGKLIKTGTGTLQFNCQGNVDSIYINAGEVYDFGDGHFNNKTIVFNGGTLRYNNSYNGDGSDNAKFIVPEGKTGILYPDGRCNYTGALTGAGTFVVNATFVRMYFQGNWSAFTGTIEASQYKSGSYDPSFDFDNTYGIGKATLKINSGTTVHTNGKNFAIGALTGSGNLDNSGSKSTAANTITVGGKDIDFTYTGAISGSNITKTGAGVWTISNASVLANAGKLTINGGAVKLNNATETVSMAGSKPVQVNNGGAIRGRGVVQSLSLASGAEYCPGVASSLTGNTGTIKTLGNFTANAGSDIYLNRSSSEMYNSKTRSPQYSFIDCEGTLTINGTVHFSYKETSWTPAAGDSAILFVANTIAGNPVFDLQPLPDGLSWDVSTVLADGVIRVTSADGIDRIDSSIASGICQVFNTAGTHVADFWNADPENYAEALRDCGLTPGIYIVRVRENNVTKTHKILLDK